MFVLQVGMKVEPQSRELLEKTYLEAFRPAISRQEGFRGVELLRPQQDGDDYRLSIAFESQALQQKWVKTDLHRQVWPALEKLCAQCTVKRYTSV